MHLGFQVGRGGTGLHRIRFHTAEGANVCRQSYVRNLREHGIGRVLHRHAHAVRLRPTMTEQNAGLRFACLESGARPAQFSASPVLGQAETQHMKALGRLMRTSGNSAVLNDRPASSLSSRVSLAWFTESLAGICCADRRARRELQCRVFEPIAI